MNTRSMRHLRYLCRLLFISYYELKVFVYRIAPSLLIPYTPPSLCRSVFPPLYTRLRTSPPTRSAFTLLASHSGSFVIHLQVCPTSRLRTGVGNVSTINSSPHTTLLFFLLRLSSVPDSPYHSGSLGRILQQLLRI